MEIETKLVTHEFNKSKIAINGSLLIACITLLIATPHLIPNSNSSLSMILFCLEVIGIFYFTYRIFFRSKNLIYRPTGSSVTYTTITLSLGKNKIEEIENMLLQFNKEQLYALSSDDKNDILIDILYSEDKRFGAYRISQYVPFQFQTVCSWTTIDEASVEQLIAITK